MGDGHDGVWNIPYADWIKASKKRERRIVRRIFLDWYHLLENLHKVGGSNQRLRQAKDYLGQGFVNDAIALFNDFPKKQARNFQNYLALTPN